MANGKANGAVVVVERDAKAMALGAEMRAARVKAACRERSAVRKATAAMPFALKAQVA